MYVTALEPEERFGLHFFVIAGNIDIDKADIINLICDSFTGLLRGFFNRLPLCVCEPYHTFHRPQRTLVSYNLTDDAETIRRLRG